MAEETGSQAKPVTKTDSWVKQHKIPLIAGGIAAIILIVIVWKSSHKTGSTASTAGANIPYSPMPGFGSGSGVTGPAGPAGPAGPRGRRGPGSTGHTAVTAHPRRHTLYWFEHHGYDVKKDKNAAPLGSPNVAATANTTGHSPKTVPATSHSGNQAGHVPTSELRHAHNR